ncbi:MAG: glycosyltransferase family 39 protein [Thermoleophilaceae bacterium]|nr:glycosyltransferase family 39 protein [Thermoleophilaceae bacterium]
MLAAIVAGGFLLRVWNNDYGLPYVYNYDEETHFTSNAVEMFGGGFDPNYYQNPSAFTYIIHAVLRLLYGDWPVIGSILELPLDTVGTQFELDPTPIWLISRSLAALLAVAGVVAVFHVGRRLWDTRVGLVAAAVVSFAFLPVAYGRIAVTDGGTLVPVALAVYGAVRVRETGARRHYLLAGAMTGLAIGFKYTAGLVLLPLLGAVALRALAAAPEPRTAGALGGRARAAGARGLARFALGLRHHVEVRSLALALAAVVAVFFLTTPFFFLDPISALYQLKTQAEAAGGAEKLGQTSSSGTLFYLNSLTWGLGFAGLVAALAGAAIVWRRECGRAVLLLLFPLALFLYMSLQSRYFARWILPAYPVLALLCGVALAHAAALLRARPRLQPAALAVLTLLVLAQPLAADVRTAEVLGHTDTRNLARDFLVDRYPPELRVAIEPALPVVPEVYYRRRPGDDAAVAGVCTGLAKGTDQGEAARGNCLPFDEQRFVREFLRDVRRVVTEPEGGPNANLTILRPELIDLYRRRGYCTVMTMSIVRQRAENAGDDRVLAYYRRLGRESDVVFEASPYRPGADPPPFDFDLSFNYYPAVFERPGPLVRVHRLRNCEQSYGEVPEQPAGTRGLDKGVGTTFVGRY